VKVVSNTTVLSNFAAIGRLEMLQSLYGEIFIPTEVHQEIQHGLEEGYGFYTAVERVIHPGTADGWIRLTSLQNESELALLAALPSRLHAGEAAGLVLAEHRGWLFLTDDKAARSIARQRQVPLSGTLGSLVLGVERQLWTVGEANRALTAILQSGFFSPVADVGDLVKKSLEK